MSFTSRVCTSLQRVQDIKVEGLDVMKLLLERRKVELKEEAEAAEAKQNADREVRFGIEMSNCCV